MSAGMRSFRLTSLLCLLSILFSVPAQAFEVVLLGESDRERVVLQWADAQRVQIQKTPGLLRANLNGLEVVAPKARASVADIADVAHHADAGVLVVDVTRGPTRMVREHVLLARQASLPTLSILLVNIGALHDPEIEELVEFEVRELLNTYEWDGEHALVFRAEAAAPGKPAATARALLGAARQRPALPPAESMRSLRAFLYLLTPEEANGKPLHASKGKRLSLWAESQRVQAQVAEGAALDPGGNGSLVLSTSSPLQARPGTRLLVLRDGAIVGLGVIEEALPAR